MHVLTAGFGRVTLPNPALVSTSAGMPKANGGDDNGMKMDQTYVLDRAA
jgi:hypothetical protein